MSRQRILRSKLLRAIGLMAVAVCLLGILATDATACPTCKQALANGHDGVSLGYYWSILFMIAMPFLIFGGWTILIWRMIKMRPNNESEQATLLSS